MAETLAPAREPQKLDELMLAMDVVDTLRHSENIVKNGKAPNGKQRSASAMTAAGTKPRGGPRL